MGGSRAGDSGSGSCPPFQERLGDIKCHTGLAGLVSERKHCSSVLLERGTEARYHQWLGALLGDVVHYFLEPCRDPSLRSSILASLEALRAHDVEKEVPGG